MYQKFLVAGNLGRDPEMRYTQNGTPVTSFSVASNRRYTSSSGEQIEETIWIRVSAWNRLAEICAEFLQKGAKVLVEGRLQPDISTGGPRIWTDSNGAARASFEMTASTVQFLSGKSPDNGAGDEVYASESDSEEVPF